MLCADLQSSSLHKGFGGCQPLQEARCVRGGQAERVCYGPPIFDVYLKAVGRGSGFDTCRRAAVGRAQLLARRGHTGRGIIILKRDNVTNIFLVLFPSSSGFLISSRGPHISCLSASLCDRVARLLGHESRG